MGKINNYTVDPVNPGDKILASDATTGDTKNVSAQSISDLATSSSIYRAYITQSGAVDPTVVLIPGNTITGTWSYNNTGDYIFTSTGTFAVSNSGCVVGVADAYDTTFEFSVIDDDSISFKSYSAGSLSDGVITDLYIEIFTHDL
jgi:hypothetical protein